MKTLHPLRVQEIKRKEEINTNEINELRNKTSSVDATIDAINSPT
ncbi:hypothetical protein ACLB1Q_20370 [Escherichia coli]